MSRPGADGADLRHRAPGRLEIEWRRRIFAPSRPFAPASGRGDTHVHTHQSFGAALFGTRTRCRELDLTRFESFNGSMMETRNVLAFA